MLLSLLKTNTKITSTHNFTLPKKILDFSRLAHVNEKDAHSSVVNALQFHPTNNLMLSAGLDKKWKLYNVNHTKSIRVQSILTKDLPIYSASFINQGKEILLSGARKYFYYYDLVKNELMKVSHIFGNHEERDLKKCATNPMSPYIAFLGRYNPKSVMVLSAKTKQLLFDLKIPSGKLQSACFNSNYIYTSDTNGNINQFDLRTRTWVVTCPDSGSYNTTWIAVSNSGKYLATGNYAGIVNVYDLKSQDLLAENQKPLKSISNLTTSVNIVEFNHSDELLSIGSKWKKNGLRMVHMESLTVYENFPSFKNNVKYPFSCSFSHDSEFFSVGNDEGNDYLFSLQWPNRVPLLS
jgi:U3 small nucleolar RNA-associated protein 18